ncbi:hypothetical protein BDV95DRAFT_592226 [Massariosphaeria phaeospora]|uniref:Uncharacterized protein n=1 Tax=Massariosphaeria phaeospora TaxID=100035 RepID=A0A7C8MBK6_9PLEO|nr:hypothetical protein BDV95DRAFT_592226 [Massariosphaeria phaeospora]
MPSAALGALYPNIGTAGRSDKPLYHNLQKHDMKALVRILSNWPARATAKDMDKYWSDTTSKITNLSSQFRSSTHHHLLVAKYKDKHPSSASSTANPLCAHHAGLNPDLINSIWTTLHHDLDTNLGPFLYPIILHNFLLPTQEQRIRQLEPLLQMWHRGFTLAGSTPPGRDPIITPGTTDRHGVFTPKWTYQTDQCAACMLARIGSDRDVLFAIFAAMVGRYKRRSIGPRGDIRSKRVRLLRCWIKLFDGGERIAGEAWDVGEEMKRVRKAWKVHRRQGRGQERGFYGNVIGSETPVSRPSTADESTGLFPPVSTPLSENAFVSPGAAPRSIGAPSVHSSWGVHYDMPNPPSPTPTPTPELPPRLMPTSTLPRSSSLYSRTTAQPPLTRSSSLYSRTTQFLPVSRSPPPTLHPGPATTTYTSLVKNPFAPSIRSQHGSIHQANSSASRPSSLAWTLESSQSDTTSVTRGSLMPPSLRTSNTEREEARERSLAVPAQAQLPAPGVASIYRAFDEEKEDWDEIDDDDDAESVSRTPIPVTVAVPATIRADGRHGDRGRERSVATLVRRDGVADLVAGRDEGTEAWRRRTDRTQWSAFY